MNVINRTILYTWENSLNGYMCVYAYIYTDILKNFFKITKKQTNDLVNTYKDKWDGGRGTGEHTHK